MNRALAFALALFAGSGPLRANDGAEDVRAVIKVMRGEISARPSRVLIAVEDALTMNERAACEIVKEAITSTRADARLTGEIVFTALKHAPAMAAVIVKCAIAVAPEAVPEIENAVRRALGQPLPAANDASEASGAVANATAGEGDASGKEPSGKGAAGVAPKVKPATLDAFLPGAVGVGGIYLISPSRAFQPGLPGDICDSDDLSPSCLRP